MESLIQFYLPLAALLVVFVNGVFIKKSFLYWLPLVLILAALTRFYGGLVVLETGSIPSIIQNGILSVLLIATFLALAYRQFFKGKGEKYQYLFLALIYVVGLGLAFSIEGDFTSGLTVLNGSKLILGVVLNVLLIALIRFKLPFLVKILKLKYSDLAPLFYKSSMIFVIGLSVYLGVFVMGWYGVAFFASLYIPTLIVISTNEDEQIFQGAGISLLSLLIIGFVYAFGKELQFEIGQSHLIWGVFIGLFLMSLGSLQFLLKKNVRIVSIIISLLIIGFVYGLGELYSVKENLGGLISYAGLLIGVSITIFNDSKKEGSFHINNALLIATSTMLFTPFFEVIDPFGEKGSNADKLVTDQKKLEVVNEKGEKVVLEMNDIREAEGLYSVFLDNSKLKFTVISHGNKTKGTFKNYKGTIKIEKNLEDSEVEIEFDAVSISTFNKVRDKEIKNDPIWMDVSNFPKLFFRAKGFKFLDGTYIAEGELTMKGISKNVNVAFDFEGKGNNDGQDFVIISGKVNLDMTDFGIEESSEVDKEVSVEFTIEANKIN